MKIFTLNIYKYYSHKIRELYRHKYRTSEIIQLIFSTIFFKLKSLQKYFLPGHKPDFIVIGAQKCGTSSLHYYLKQHPSLVGSSPKEIHYFDKKVELPYSLKRYEKHFTHLFPKNKLFYESTPKYIFEKNVAKKISECYPDIKLILVLRNPVQRAYSAWNMHRIKFEENKRNYLNNLNNFPEKKDAYLHFFQNSKKFPDFKDFIQFEQSQINSGNLDGHATLRRGLYAQQIKEYYSYFRKEQILILGFKDFTNQTEQTLEKIYQFLGVESMPFSKLNVKPKGSRTYNTRMSTEEEAFLENYYAEPNKELFELLGYELNW